jgi:ABC-type multidrug transport system permease subunit
MERKWSKLFTPNGRDTNHYSGLQFVVAVTVGSLFLRVKVSEKGAKQRTSFIAFILALLIFTSTEAIGVFLEERQIYIRETSRGAYRAASYVLSGALVAVPFLLMLAIIFTCSGYFIVGLVADPGAFFIFILCTWLTLMAANSYVMFISSLVPNFTVGNSLCSASLAYFFLFSGFFIQR